MAWIDAPGLAGKVYVPGNAGQTLKKHPCKACFSCQWCDENRCRVCRGERADAGETKELRRCKHKQPARPANHTYRAPIPK
jgi:hypothetical protein